MAAAAPARAPEPDSLRHRPSSALAPYVRSISGYDLTGVDVVHHGLPSTDLTFLLALDAPLMVGWSADRSRSRGYSAMVSGLHSSPAFIFPSAHRIGIQLGLTPLGARALFGLRAAELHADLVDVGHQWTALGGQLLDKMSECGTWRHRFAVLDRELVGLVGPAGIRRELTWAWHQLVHRGAVQTAPLAAEIGWSRGYFARVFAAEFGLKPKETARIVRFGAAKKVLSAVPPLSGIESTGPEGSDGVTGFRASLADVAHRCGYSDQAHLTREWRRLAGCTPTEWQAEMLAFVQDGTTTDLED